MRLFRFLLYALVFASSGTQLAIVPILGVVMGMLNGVWAVTALLSPLLAGLAADRLGPRVVFGLTEAVCLTVLAATVAMTWRPRHPGQNAPGTGTGIAAARRPG